jgi:hypothetical protein
MLTAEAAVASVERKLAAGELCCPGCGGVLARWGHARRRALRGRGGALTWLRPRRVRCTRCLVTHVLLPVTALARHADVAEVMGAALAAHAVRIGNPRLRSWVKAVEYAAGWPGLRPGISQLLVAAGRSVMSWRSRLAKGSGTGAGGWPKWMCTWPLSPRVMSLVLRRMRRLSGWAYRSMRQAMARILGGA